MAAAAEGGVLEPVECEEGALDPAELAQRLGKAVLARVGGELLQHDRGSDRAELDGRGQAQELIPALLDEVDLDGAGDERLEASVVGGPVQDVEAPVGEVAHARGEAEAEKVAEAEDVVGGAGRIGVMLADLRAGSRDGAARRGRARLRRRWRR